jgi:NAD-dependent DNA ligase
LKLEIEAAGFAEKSVSKNTTYVLAGEEAGFLKMCSLHES